MINFDNLKNKKIAILGLGIENQEMLKYLSKQKLEAKITICDMREKQDLAERLKEIDFQFEFKTGSDFNQGLDAFDILFRSPGWSIACPGIQLALKKKVVLYSPMKLFMDFCPSKNIIGVTGTKGKGTTSSLIYEILKTAKKDVYLGGNIGLAPFSFLEKLNQDSFVVLELSSFQLEDFHSSPKISVLTNLYPEHLSPADPMNPNFHSSMKDYWQAKQNIFRFQTENDYLIINEKIQEEIVKTKAKIIKYKKSEIKSKLVGEHNKENIAGAFEVAKILKIENKIIEKAVNNFQGLPFRIEFITEKNGIKYYNDSFATTPEATEIALNSFVNPIVLLAGGADKGSCFFQLAKKIKEKVKYVILFKGKGSDKIILEFHKVDFPEKKYIIVDSMTEAMKIAKQKAQAGDIILLSTACASFGVFKNYKERGKLFNENI